MGRRTPRPRNTQWRCTVPGCDIFMVWQEVLPGETHRGGEHYDRVHADRGRDAQAVGQLADMQRYAADREKARIEKLRAERNAS